MSKNNNNLYNILNTFNKLNESAKPAEVQPKAKTLLESSMEQVLSEKYVGFKAVEKSAKAGGAENPAAVAAAVGRKKYGKEKFQKAAAAGKKMGEGTDPFANVEPRVEKPTIKGTDKKAKSGYYPSAKAPVKKLDKPLDETSQTYKDAMAMQRSAGIQGRADSAEARMKQRAAHPKTIGQKVKQDIVNPLKKLAKGDVKGALGEDAIKALLAAGYTKEQIAEGWDDMLKDVEKKRKEEKGTGKFDKKKISTGTVHTRKYDPKSGETEDNGKDGEGKDKEKRGRGRPKKTNESHATIDKMVAGLFESTMPMMDAEEPQLTYEQDHLKQYLGNNLYSKLENSMKLDNDFPDDLYDNLYDYYLDEMPYGTAKARTGDPYQWIQEKLATVFPQVAENKDAPQAQLGGVAPLAPTQKPEGILSRAGRAVVGGLGKVAHGVNKAIGHGSDEELLQQLANKKTMDEELNDLTRLAGMAESKKSPKADKDYDKDGKIESEKDEVIGSRRKAAGLDESKAKPDFLDVDKDGDKDEPMKKAVKDIEKVDECMGMVGTGGEQEGSMNISTNMSTDGTKNVTITASGAKADELAQMLKLAGMQGGTAPEADPQVTVGTIEVGANDETESPEEYEATPSPSYDEEQEEVDEDSRYEANTTPEEKVMPTQALTKGGDGDVAGQEKKMNPTKPTWKNGDNAMSESISLKLMKEYESIKVRK